MRFCQRNKESFISVFARSQVLLQVNLCTGIEVNDTLLVALAENDTFALIEVNVLTIEFHQLAHTHTSRSQQVYNGEVTNFSTIVTELFDILITQYFLYLCPGFYLMYPTDRAFNNVVFFFEPSEEGRKYPADIVNGHSA